MIPDFPEDVKWLSPEERTWVQDRLREDVGKSGHTGEKVKFRDLKMILTDYKVLAPFCFSLSKHHLTPDCSS